MDKSQYLELDIKKYATNMILMLDIFPLNLQEKIYPISMYRTSVIDREIVRQTNKFCEAEPKASRSFN